MGHNQSNNENENKSPNITVVLCGNPGAGKSAVANAYGRLYACKSTLSFETCGITTELQSVQSEDSIGNSVEVIDIPGLVDMYCVQRGIDCAFLALSNPTAFYKLNFVLTLQAGRVKPNDIVGINYICKAITSEFTYGIIINQLTSRAMKELNRDFYFDLFCEICGKKPKYLTFIEFEKKLEYIERSILSEKQQNKIRTFIDEQQSHQLQMGNITETDRDSLESKRNAAGNQVTEYYRKKHIPS